MLINVQPAVAFVRAPVALVGQGPPDGNTIKTHQQIIGIPDLGEGLPNLGDMDIPLSALCPMP